MKALFALLFLVSIGFTSLAGSGESDYLITRDGKVIYAKIHFGLLVVKTKSVDGVKQKTKFSDVLSYKKNGDIYERKSLYQDNKNTGKEVFMKLVGWRNGYRIYSYNDYNTGLPSCSRYYVYLDDNTFWLEVTCRNYESVNLFFKG